MSPAVQPAAGSIPDMTSHPPPPGAPLGRILGLIPHRTGYVPSRKLYAIGHIGSCPAETAIITRTLPEAMGYSPAVTGRLAAHMIAHVRAGAQGGRVTGVTVAAYGLGDQIESLAGDFAAAAMRQDVRLRDVIEVQDPHYRSRMPDGTARPWMPVTPPSRSDITGLGLVAAPYPSREAALAAISGGPLPASVMAAAWQRYRVLAARPGSPEAAARAAEEAVAGALRAHQGGSGPGSGQMAWLQVLLTDPWALEAAMRQAEDAPGDAVAARELWAQVTASAGRGMAAGPACMLSYTSLQRGISGLAGVALERAETDQPGHPLAARLRKMLHGAQAPRAACAAAAGPGRPLDRDA